MESSIYTSFSRCRTNLLSIVRNGFWRPDFVLTDGQFIYGKLMSNDMMRREMVIETIDGWWLIRPNSLLSRERLIFDTSKGEVIGKTILQKWNHKVDLEMTSGFNAVLQKKGVFSASYYWTDGNLFDLMSISSQFKYSTPFAINIDQNAFNAGINIPLITLLGVHTMLLKQSQVAYYG